MSPFRERIRPYTVSGVAERLHAWLCPVIGLAGFVGWHVAPTDSIHPLPRFLIAFGVGWSAAALVLEPITRRFRGRYRQAQADHRDSRAHRGAFPALGYTVTVNAAGAFTLTPADAGTGEDELEVVKEDLPILAHRAARLRFAGTDQHWGTVNTSFGTFGVDLKAQCKRRASSLDFGSPFGYPSRPHAAPDAGCECGIYALPPDVQPSYTGAGLVTLLVELSGRIIEHEKGYRAGHQRVIECQLPPCPYCRAPAEVVDARDGEMYAATCREHLGAVPLDENPTGLGRVVVSVENLRHLLPVPVTCTGEARP